MTTSSKTKQDYIDRLTKALRNIEISEKEMTDMRLLYKSTNGNADVGSKQRGSTALAAWAHTRA